VTILLVRHAAAGKRKRWQGDDRLLPLDDRGREQAARLPALLERYDIDRICSSPYVRCRETVEPLAEQLDLDLEERDELAEGAGRRAALALAQELSESTPVLCTHGDVVVALLGEESEKGSTCVLELTDGELIRIEYLPPAS
jgi:phosphohistidine phosphatase SixA